MSNPIPALERIATALEDIRTLLDRLCPPPQVPSLPDQPWGRESIQILDEEELWQLEQEEDQRRQRGYLPPRTSTRTKGE
jgi:hypothetical protein